MHYAVHRHTAAELIVGRANAQKEHMGLTTWENAPDGKIVKPDVSIAKNYLKQTELEDMGRLVNAVLDMAERMAKRHIPLTMEDWAKRIDLILEAGGDAVLDTLRLNLSSNSPKPNLKSIALFRTRTFLPTSTDLSVILLCHLILCRKTSESPNHKENATAFREDLHDAISGYH